VCLWELGWGVRWTDLPFVDVFCIPWLLLFVCRRHSAWSMAKEASHSQ